MLKRIYIFHSQNKPMDISIDKFEISKRNKLN